MSTRSEFRGIQWDVDAVAGADFLLTVPFTQDALPLSWAGVTVTAAIVDTGQTIQAISVSTAVAGQLTFSLTEVQTAALGKGRRRWAVSFTIAGQTFPVLAGRFELHLSEIPAVTPPPASSIEVSPSGVTAAVPLGLPATIAIGTVTTLAAGVPASATITGTGTTRELNLGLPRAASGRAARLRSGWWTHVPDGNVAASVVANAQPLICPIDIADPVTLDRIGVEVTAGGAAGSVIRLGIYADAGGVPGALVADWGTVPSTGIGVQVASISTTLAAGAYWLVMVPQGAPASNPSIRLSGSGLSVPVSSTLPANLAGFVPLPTGGVAGALPGTLTMPGTSSSSTPKFVLRPV